MSFSYGVCMKKQAVTFFLQSAFIFGTDMPKRKESARW